MTEERFRELLEGYVDGPLGEADSRELLEAFGEEAELKTRFVDELRLANSLRGLPLLDDGRLSEDVCESIRHSKGTSDLTESVLTELRNADAKIVPFPFIRIAVGLAAAIAVALLVFIPTGPDSGTALATVAHMIDAVWVGEIQPSSGSSVGSGRLSLASGVARLDFADGVRVTLEGPAEFELIGPGETRLHSGNLTAHVPPEGIGFQVHTERAEIVDLGTTFGVFVGKDGATDVAVFEGEVEVTSVKSREEKIIQEGSTVKLEKGSEGINPVQFESVAFRSGWPILFGVKNTGGRIRFVNAQPIRNPNEVVDRENIIVFPERFGVSPENPIEVTFSEPGRFRAKKLMDRGESLSLNGREVNTYLLQYNPPFVKGIPNSDQVNFSGHVTFDRPILAVITNTNQLLESDPHLGKRRFEYPSNPLRGLEHGDSLSLSEDRRTLEVDWLVMQALEKGLDQVRVIVEAEGAIAAR